MNRRTIYTIAVAILIFFVFFNPFGRNKENDVPLPYVRSDVLDELESYLVDRYQTPEAYLAGLFRNHSIVFLGEFGRIAQQVEVVQNAIPLLYEAGVRNLGMEFALFEDTGQINEIITASSFDEQAVSRILFNRMVLWGYQDYLDVFRAAWELNAALPDDAPKFRIVGLNVPVNWYALEDERDMQDPEIIAQVYNRGVPDDFMAETILEQFVRRDEPALIYVSIQHAFTSFVLKEYAEKAQEMGLSEARRLGNIVFDRIGTDAATVLFHAPWPYDRAQTLITHPADGAIDRLLKELPEAYQRAGFDVPGTPFGHLDAERNDFAKEYDDLLLSDLCDGYIITGPIAAYEPVVAIPGFITEENLDEAMRRFPGPNLDPVTAEELNSYIAGVIDSTQQLIDRF